MDNLILTIILSLILMGLVIIGLSIGLILTGKSRLKRGCGLTPGKSKKDKNSCPICGEEKSCNKNAEKQDEPRQP